MNREQLRDYRAQTVPLFNSQKLKLGVFALNCSGGSITNFPTDRQMSWDYNKSVIQLADRIGMEIALPIGRFKGQGGSSNHNGSSYEVYTWAAAMAAATENIMCFATSHVALTHPVVAAKQAATIDHVSRGRFGLNVVMGWFTEEMAMFNVALRKHDDRYRYGGEWLSVVKRLWSEDGGFDFEGEYLKLVGLESEPKPIQRPGPVLVNADICFGSPAKPEDIDQLLAVKTIADEKYNRDVALMCSALVVCRDTEQEAQAAFQDILDNGDWEAARSMLSALGVQSGSFNEGYDQRMRRFVAGYGTRPLVGTPEQIVDMLIDYSNRGLHGIVFYFKDYLSELTYFSERVMPLLKQAGLRH